MELTESEAVLTRTGNDKAGRGDWLMICELDIHYFFVHVSTGAPWVKVLTVITSVFPQCSCARLYESLVSLGFSCLCFKHADIFIFLPPSSHCARACSTSLQVLKTTNMPFLLVEQAALLHTIICSHYTVKTGGGGGVAMVSGLLPRC